MKRNIKKSLLTKVAKIVLGTAKQAAGAASWWDTYQPKEPANIKDIKK